MFKNIKLWDSNSIELSKLFKNSNLEIRVVGGCVRDYLVNLPINDIDFATNAYPEVVTDICEKAGYKVIPTGIEHGTVTVVINNEPYEITTLRKDVATDGRKATISYAETFEEDAMRRDFTFNALSMDAEGNIYDYFDGEQDLKNNLIRFIGDADQRIKEDYLRILRYFRFRTKLGLKVYDDYMTDTFKETIAIIEKNAPNLKILSGERINSEFKKMSEYGLNRFLPNLILMNNSSVLENIGLKRKGTYNLPFEKNKDWILNDFNYSESDYAYKLYLIIYKHGITEEDLVGIKKAWKLDNETYNKMLFIHRNIFLEFEDSFSLKKKAILEKISEKDIIDYIVFLDKSHLINDSNFLPKFPIQGKDLMDLGYKQGVELGEKLKSLQDVWIDSKFSLSKEELLEGLDNELGTNFKM